MSRRVLVTAALPYSNGRPHVGHIAGAYLPSDIYVRFLRLCGVDVRYVCGSDDHGVAIMLSAEKEKKTPAEVAAYYNAKQQEAFSGLGIHFDVYGSTSRTKFHTKASQDFFLKLHEKGYFEKQKSRQFYDQSRSMFLPDRFVQGTCDYCATPDQNGDQCENCGKMLDVDTLRDARSVVSGTPATIKETVHWFLDLSRFEKEVRSWLDKAEIRDHTRNYVQGLLSTGLVKRSMTRDISWGIPVPLDDPDAQGKVLYVWFDAPIGYISNSMELCEKRDGNPQAFKEWWQSKDTEIVHFIGEDNTIFHCVIWIAMLCAAGEYELPRGVIVNQFLNIKFPGKEEEKISKSRGTAVWIEEYLAEGGDPDVLRYYLTYIAPERARTAYRPDDMIQRNNTDLANVIGNFVNRVISFTHKYHGPTVPPVDAGKVGDLDREFEKSFKAVHEAVTQDLEKFQFKAALERLMEFGRECNKYIDDKAPWKTRKDDMEGTLVTLNYALRAIHFLGVTLQPFLPFTSEKILKMLTVDAAAIKWDDALKAPPVGSQIQEPVILFQKIENS